MKPVDVHRVSFPARNPVPATTASAAGRYFLRARLVRLRMGIAGDRDCLRKPDRENRARCLTTAQTRKWNSSGTAIAVTNCAPETAPAPSAAAFPLQDVIKVRESPAGRALQCQASRAPEAGRLPREDREGKLPCLKAVPSAAETVAGVGWPEFISSNLMQKPSAVRWQGEKRRESGVYTPVNEHLEAFSKATDVSVDR